MDRLRAYDRAVCRLTRREVLKIAGAAGLAAVGRPVISARTIEQPIFASYPFTLGVASGDPLPDGVVLWTRLAPDPLDGGGMPMTNVEVRWEIAADSRFAKIVRHGAELARPELGHSVHVEASGLEAGRDYWYRFRAGGEVSQTGRTRSRDPESRRWILHP